MEDNIPTDQSGVSSKLKYSYLGQSKQDAYEHTKGSLTKREHHDSHILFGTTGGSGNVIEGHSGGTGVNSRYKSKLAQSKRSNNSSKSLSKSSRQLSRNRKTQHMSQSSLRTFNHIDNPSLSTAVSTKQKKKSRNNTKSITGGYTQ